MQKQASMPSLASFCSSPEVDRALGLGHSHPSASVCVMSAWICVLPNAACQCWQDQMSVLHTPSNHCDLSCCFCTTALILHLVICSNLAPGYFLSPVPLKSSTQTESGHRPLSVTSIAGSSAPLDILGQAGCPPTTAVQIKFR